MWSIFLLWTKTITNHRGPKGLPRSRDLPLSPGTECNTPAQVWFHRTAGKAVSQLAACHINCSNLCLETRKEECGEMQARGRQGRPGNPHLDPEPQRDGARQLANSQDPSFLSKLCRLRGDKGILEDGTSDAPTSSLSPFPLSNALIPVCQMPAVPGTVTPLPRWLITMSHCPLSDWIRAAGM